MNSEVMQYSGIHRRMTVANPAFVLVEPQLGENIGATARAMLNFGLADLILVNPRDGWPNASAVAMASGAGRVLDGAKVFGEIGPALANFHFVLATTARTRDLSKPVFSPERAMTEARSRVEDGQRVAVMFGPERSGLDNVHLAEANAILDVPTDPAFRSLNVAQCALLVAYEWQLSVPVDVPSRDTAKGDRNEPASVHEKSVLCDLYSRDLESARYFWPEDKAASMRMSLRNMFMRQDFSKAEVRTLHGIRNALRRSGPVAGEVNRSGSKSSEQ